jgi:cytochrome c oxidase assembly factor CtaG
MQQLLPLAVLPPLSGSGFLRTDANPAAVAVLCVGLGLYLAGVRRQNRLHPRHPWPARRTAAFLGSVVVNAVAVLSFLGAYDGTLFWDHMVQHLMLIMVGAILLAASSPIALLWRATTGGTHRRVTALLRSTPGLVAGHPVTAFVLYGVFVPLTHLTVFFGWAAEYSAVDQSEHLLFLVVGYLFWRQIFGVDPNRFRMQPPMRALLLFLAVPVDTFVGLTLDSETREIFPALAAEHRRWGPSLVTDLHVGGVVMWVGGDILMMLALIPVVVGWVRREERSATRFDRELQAYFPRDRPAGQPTAGFALGRHRTRAAPDSGGRPLTERPASPDPPPLGPGPTGTVAT